MDPDRFHRAAREGHLDLLQEANRKELNARDEDGMTPAMWAAYYGRLDALRLIVGRGGDPDKCDHYGNTSLHCAAGNGHTDCVSFLVNFGVNLWALDNDFHAAKDVAVLNQRQEVLRLLDAAQSKHALVNRKLVQRLKEKSVYDAEKRVKRYRKLQTKAAKRAEKEERERTAARKDSRSANPPKFSDIVNSGERREVVPQRSTSTDRRKKSVVFRPGDILRRRDSDPDLGTLDSQRTTRSDSTTTKRGDDHRTPSPDRPGSDTQSSSDDANSDVLQTADSGIGDELHDGHVSIFDRPGFGTVSFRNSVLHLNAMIDNNNGRDANHRYEACNHPGRDDRTVSSFRSSILHLNAMVDNNNPGRDANRNLVNGTINDSIGSASSLVRRHITWEDEYDEEDEEEGSEEDDVLSNDEEESAEEEPLSLLLAAVGLSEYLPLFRSEQIDLEALSLLSEEDLKALGMPLGPRRKLGRAVQERIKIMQDPGVFQDSPL